MSSILPDMRYKLKYGMRKVLLIASVIFIMMTLSGLACFAWLWRGIPFSDAELDQVMNIPASPALYDTNGQLFHVRLSPDSEWQIPIELSQMGPWLPKIAIAVEDGRFYSHHGVDPLAIMRAAFQNLTSGHVVSGASTITSQVIRMALSERGYINAASKTGATGATGKNNVSRRRSERNFETKAREFIMAFKLERMLSSHGKSVKEFILKQYLNRAPFGGNIRGVQAAAMIYFGKPASRLSPGEACLLIGMLKSPTHYRPDTQPEAARQRRDLIIKLMAEKKVLSPDGARRALLEDLPTRYTRFALPMRAWHFAEMVFKSKSKSSSVSNSGAIHTSLKLEMQSKLEAILRQSVRELPENITIAAGVVDNRTAQLVAWVGNARFNLVPGPRPGAASWVDCGIAPRSPGSTLKPFAYLSAIDQGLLTPASLLADTPGSLLGRAPRNFDLQYRGAVTTRVALSESLNAPAVRVLRLAGQDRVLRLMRDFGLSHLTESAAYYGDSLILGGCDVTVLEELEAFTTLASLGVHRPLSLFADNNYNDDSDTSLRLASQAACWIVCDILNYRGQLAVFARGTLGQKWQLALKTGTSYGLRDAWTAAWTPDYTTVVWVGAPDGSSWPGLVGATAAAPVAVRILRTLSPGSGWYEIPDGLEQRKVCSLSGLPPTAACPSTRLDWSVKSVTRTFPCNLHTIKAGQTQILWPEELLAPRVTVTSNANLSSSKNKNVTVRRSANLIITSPIESATYFTAPFDLERRIPMKAEGAISKVFWYLDGNYIGASSPGETFFHSVPDGTHDIGAADVEGRSAHTTVKVVTPGRERNKDRDSAPLLLPSDN